MSKFTKDPRFNEGDHVRVTGDTNRRWQHLIRDDTLVELLRYDSSDDSWEVRVTEGDDEGRMSWVAQIDIAPDFDPVTPDEEDEVIASILKGVTRG